MTARSGRAAHFQCKSHTLAKLFSHVRAGVKEEVPDVPTRSWEQQATLVDQPCPVLSHHCQIPTQHSCAIWEPSPQNCEPNRSSRYFPIGKPSLTLGMVRWERSLCDLSGRVRRGLMLGQGSLSPQLMPLPVLHWGPWHPMTACPPGQGASPVRDLGGFPNLSGH